MCAGLDRLFEVKDSLHFVGEGARATLAWQIDIFRKLLAVLSSSSEDTVGTKPLPERSIGSRRILRRVARVLFGWPKPAPTEGR
jgi:hypothetical protein